jgi:hypothetical protein
MLRGRGSGCRRAGRERGQGRVIAADDGRSTTRPTRVLAYIGLAAVLSVVAFVASRLRLPDTFFYTNAAERGVVPGCAEIHCFRVLVPWTIGALPGPSLLKWKGYAVVCNAAAALAIFDLALVFGLSRRAALIAGGFTVFGFGSFYTLFEPYTSDPLMFWLTPVAMRLALEDRAARAGAVACVGVFAKEFIVFPIAIVGAADMVFGRWRRALRLVAAGAAAFTVWLALNLLLRSAFGYTYGPNKSPRLLSGSYLFFWLNQMSPRGAASAMFNEFGPQWLLIPFGWLTAPRKLRELMVSALPLACLFSYVQQPDRALWNFHFLTSPLAALVLEPLPNAFVAAFLAVFAFANLKVGAQVSFIPPARYAFAVGLVLAAIAIVVYLRSRRLASIVVPS